MMHGMLFFKLTVTNIVNVRILEIMLDKVNLDTTYSTFIHSFIYYAFC